MNSNRRHKISILVVEDVEEMRSLFEHVLKGIEGVELSGLAMNGIEARQVLTRRRPDLVFLDEVLPGESSLDILKELFEESIPVVLVTSMDDPLVELPVGALMRIAKPGWKTIPEDQVRLSEVIFRAVKRSQA